MSDIQDALAILRDIWHHVRLLDFAHLLDYKQWLGYGVGIDEQGGHLVLFCRTVSLPLSLALVLEDLGSQRYRLLVNGRGIDIRLVVTGPFVSLGGGPPGPFPPMIGAGGRVMASWREDSANQTGEVGTIGAILRKAGDPKPWLLSANHVIGINCAASNEDFKVHLTDGATPGEVVGTVVNCIRMSSAPCPADAAAVRIDLPVSRIITAHPSGLTNRTPFDVSNGMVAGAAGVVFRKAGAATGNTTSRFVAVQATLSVDVDFRGNVELTDQIVAEPFADEGDSGSLAVETTSGRPVGLVVAKAKPAHTGGEQLTVVSPIGSALQALPAGFSLVLPGDVL